MPGISYNTGPGGLMYAPARDFAYNYPQVVACIRNAFEKGYWPQLLELLGSGLVTEEGVWNALCDANDAFAKFIAVCCQDSTETFADVVARSGWQNVPEIGKIGWLAMLGEVMMGQLFQGLRDITKEGATAPSCMEQLLRSGFDSVLWHNSNGDEDELRQNGAARLFAAVRTLRLAGVSPTELRNVFETALVSE